MERGKKEGVGKSKDEKNTKREEERKEKKVERNQN